MDDYKYKGIPLTPTIARDHILDYLRSHPVPVKREELVTYAAEQHEKRGGKGVANPIFALKKALNGLVDEEKVRRPLPGYYSIGKDLAASETEEAAITAASVAVEGGGVNEAIVPADTIGYGDELVYVYYQATDRRLAELEGRTFWPCKVGFTAGNLTNRIFEQFPSTGLAHLPIVGLVIRTDDGRALEKAIHFALDQAEARIDDAVGTEWFNTSPEGLRAWHRAHLESVEKLRTTG